MAPYPQRSERPGEAGALLDNPTPKPGAAGIFGTVRYFLAALSRCSSSSFTSLAAPRHRAALGSS